MMKREDTEAAVTKGVSRRSVLKGAVAMGAGGGRRHRPQYGDSRDCRGHDQEAAGQVG
jgi:hypothetical protein